MTKKAILILFFLILAGVAAAAPPRYQYTYYSKDSGLGRTIIEDIAQDGNGCLWLATWSGLYRYDGKRFTNFKISQAESRGKRINNRFDRLSIDAFGQLWALSYDHSLYRFNLREESFSRVDCDREITGIFRLSSDDFRLLTSDNTILRVTYSDSGRNYELTEYMKLDGAETVNDIQKDAEDNIWVLTDKALYGNRSLVAAHPSYCYEEYDGAIYIGSADGVIVEFINGRVFELKTELKQEIRMISKLPGELEFLIGSAGGGFSMMTLDEWKITPVREDAYFVAEPRALKDSNGNIWIYSPEGSINIFDRESLSIEPFFCNDSGVSVWDAESNIHCAFIDRQDNIWIAGSWGGVGKAVLKEYNFRLLPVSGEDGGAEDNSVRALMQSATGIIYAGTKEGKVHLFDRELHHLSEWDAGTQVYSLTEDRDGRIWIGTKGDGIIENTVTEAVGIPAYRPRAHRKSDAPFASTSELVYCIRPDRDGRVWIASVDGRISYTDTDGEERKFVSRADIPGFPDGQLTRARFITFDREGTMYVCGTSGILSCDNPGDEPEQLRFEVFKNVSEYDIQHILFASDGKMYASSFGNGFLLMDSSDPESGYKAWTTEDGLLSDFVLSAVEDRSGNIWVISSKGLNKLDPKSGAITGWAGEHIRHNLILSEGAPLLTADGRILLNTSSGILHFNPEEILNTSYVPRVFVSSCYVSGKRTLPKGRRGLSIHRREGVIVNFTAVDMSAPESIVRSYRLDSRGDGEWIRLGSSQNINLDRLGLGRHCLEMKATNANGLDVGNSISMDIVVWPSLIPTLFALFVVLTATLYLMWLVVRRRRSLREAAVAAGGEEAGESLAGDDLRFKNAFLVYLDENLDNGEVTAEDIAAALNISRSVLFDKCRTLLGKAPTEYLRDLRFEKAAQMLREGGYSISQIAYQTGFNDSHYFSKAFRKRFGMTPSEYRKSFKA